MPSFVCLESPSTVQRRSVGATKEDLNESDNEVNDDESSPKSMKKSGKPTDNEEDTFLERFQQQQRKREKLETKAKISHRVFSPFYPEVNPSSFSFPWAKLAL